MLLQLESGQLCHSLLWGIYLYLVKTLLFSTFHIFYKHRGLDVSEHIPFIEHVEVHCMGASF